MNNHRCSGKFVLIPSITHSSRVRLIRRMARQDRLNPEHLQFDFNRMREKLGLPLA